jgi:hypothetical protein
MGEYMIGAPFYNDRNRFYVQTNNPTDIYLRKVGGREWLETCGPTAAVNCLASLGHDLTCSTPGGYQPQPEEILHDWMNDPRKEDVRESIRKGVGEIPGNRVPQFYPRAVFDVFGARGEFLFTHSWDFIIEKMYEKKAVQVCLVSPGHYLAIVAYDPEMNDLIYNDSWPGRTGTDGFNLRMSKNMYLNNVKKFAIVYV